jgi:hypothetical protein
MGYQPRTRSPRKVDHEYTKPLREKNKSKQRKSGHAKSAKQEEKHIATAQEISEATLKRLHTMGTQKFGSSPFGEYFDRWFATVEAVLVEFESNPNVLADEQFIGERAQILSGIKQKLETRRQEEATLEGELKNLSENKVLLERVKAEQVNSLKELRAQKNGELKRLYSSLNRLKKSQDEVVRMKTGFFRGISRKEREQKEAEIAQSISNKQREAELVMLNFRTKQGKLQDDYEKKRTPVLERMKGFQKKIDDMETDGSLEERWFACEALADAVNSFLQRKAFQREKQE